MGDRTFYETGVGNEVTQDNMTKLARDVFSIQLGAAATAAVTNYLYVPRDCEMVASYAVISADPSTNGATVTVKNGSTTYATHSFASGASAGDSDAQDMTPIRVTAGTVLTLSKAATTTAACTASVTLVFKTLDA